MVTALRLPSGSDWIREWVRRSVWLGSSLPQTVRAEDSPACSEVPLLKNLIPLTTHSSPSILMD